RQMRRRDFLMLLGASSAAWPLAARAQQPRMPVVGFFTAGSTASFGHIASAFRDGLRELGFIEGQNVAIEYPWAEDQYDGLPALAADLIQRRVSVIAAGPRATDAAKALTTSIPIVFLAGSDPVRTGLVASLNRPGGNLTGVTVLAADLTAKRFGMLHDAVPQAGMVGVLWDSTLPRPEFAIQEVEAAARVLGVKTRVMTVGTENEIESAFATFAREGVGAVFVNNGFRFFSLLRGQLAMAAARHRIPASYEQREHVDAGGLMSY